jgi:hypothetical protein
MGDRPEYQATFTAHYHRFPCSSLSPRSHDLTSRFAEPGISADEKASPALAPFFRALKYILAFVCARRLRSWHMGIRITRFFFWAHSKAATDFTDFTDFSVKSVAVFKAA